MATVKQLMEEKRKAINYTVAGADAVLKALGVMADANIGAVMVTEDKKIVGIFTERDYSRRCELKGLAADNTPVREVMTEQMMTVVADTTIDQCMRLMNQYHIRHLPVVEDNTMIGIISIRDVVDALVSDRESTIKGLENYILGSDFAA
jgi:CBS domain-containing protein